MEVVVAAVEVGSFVLQTSGQPVPNALKTFQCICSHISPIHVNKLRRDRRKRES